MPGIQIFYANFQVGMSFYIQVINDQGNRSGLNANIEILFIIVIIRKFTRRDVPFFGLAISSFFQTAVAKTEAE